MSDDLPAARVVGTIVIPAHNEASVIGRCLVSLADDPAAASVQVVVVANGSTDSTASIARQFEGCFAWLDVIELSAASKTGALNAGDEIATGSVRIYLDADITLHEGALSALLTALSVDAACVAAPTLDLDLRGCSRLVRLFYAAFARLPYVRVGLVGLGVYGLSATGRTRFGQFPDLMGDDLFVQSLFRPEETLTSSGTFMVRPPRTGRDLLAIRTRVAAGNAQLDRSVRSSYDGHRSTVRTLRDLLRMVAADPRLLPAAGVYVAVTIIARQRAGSSRLASGEWLRDDSSRV